MKENFFTITYSYFITSLKSISTYLLIFFNLYILYGIISNKILVSDSIIYFFLQSVLSIIVFCFILLSVSKIKWQGKYYTEKIKISMFIFVIILLIFYGVAIGILGSAVVNTINIKINIDFLFVIISVILFEILYLIYFFKDEKKRIEEDFTWKTFFEPAAFIFPTYIAILLISLLNSDASWVIVTAKTLADIIITSPLNAKEPYLLKLLLNHHKMSFDEFDNMHSKKVSS